MPRAAGAPLYVQRGFGSAAMGRVIGLLVVAAGMVSAAALVNGFIGYTGYFVTLNAPLLTIAVVGALAGIASWGIAESVMVAAFVTIIEVLGLVAVIFTGIDSFARLPVVIDATHVNLTVVPVVLSRALLAFYAFYAFIGFEDMVEVAEEVRDVRRNLPHAIVWTLGITTVLYLLLAGVAVLSIEPPELAESAAPLADLFERNTGLSGAAIGVIGMFAIINGAPIQTIMASRVLYGLSSRGQLPSWFARIHPRTRTPLLANPHPVSRCRAGCPWSAFCWLPTRYSNSRNMAKHHVKRPNSQPHRGIYRCMNRWSILGKRGLRIWSTSNPAQWVPNRNPVPAPTA
jgi:APA family basic amino acid/polyamine antiporter